MIFNIDNYRIHFKNLKISLDRRTPKERDYWASFFGATAPCPILAVCYFQAELYGMTPSILKTISICMPLYGITEVQGYRGSNDFETRSKESTSNIKKV